MRPVYLIAMENHLDDKKLFKKKVTLIRLPHPEKKANVYSQQTKLSQKCT